MNPMYRDLTGIAAGTRAGESRETQIAVGLAELERDLGLVFTDLSREQPRVTNYLPELALNTVLGRLHRAGRLGGGLHPLLPRAAAAVGRVDRRGRIGRFLPFALAAPLGTLEPLERTWRQTPAIAVRSTIGPRSLPTPAGLAD
jgi:hypothetical protein